MKKLFVAGHKGMAGSAICRANSEYELITFEKKYLNLKDQLTVDFAIKETKPDAVIICAAKVGGIYANNSYSAEFIYDNLMIQSNIINSSYKHGVGRLLFLGSSCIYPKFAPQPISENHLLTSVLEPTNEAYAIAKIAGLKMCQYYRKQYGVTYHSVMPTNLYGLNDNYHPENSHVIPGLIHRFHQAKVQSLPEVKIWGSGTPKREFLFVDDLAKICLQLLKVENPPDWVNVGTDQEMTILELAKKISKVIGYEGSITTGDPSMDGTPRKKLDCTLLKTMIQFEETLFEQGLKISYQDYLQNTNGRNNF
jgi:GDP-L-fucose synthase